MDIKSIVEYDAKHNNGVENGYEIFLYLMSNGFTAYKTDNTVFVYIKDEQNKLRYHSIHNGSLKQFLKAYEKFFAHIKHKADVAYTRVTNKKLKVLVSRYFKGITEINNDMYTTYLRN